MQRLRNTKIVATLGPASNDPETVQQLCEAGVNVFRLNFSHGLFENHKRAVENIRDVEAKFKRPLAIMLDLQGPKLRIGTFKDKIAHLHAGQNFQLDLDKTPGDNTRAFFGHASFYKSLVPGTSILLDDGKVLLQVDQQYSDRVVTKVLTGNELSDHKGVNLPGVLLEVDAMTSKDCEDLTFGLKLGVDWVAISFVQSAEDIKRARAKMPDHMKVIAKIEKPLAIQNLDTIIDVSDGIMVARGDLGVELPLEQVPGLQKQILRACHLKGKPVIVATQLLDSMVHSPSPTRAEVSDVANAVYDGADSVMLSAESASGLYPVEAVKMMDRIIRQVEQESCEALPSYPLPFDPVFCSALISAIPQIVQNANVVAIAAFSQTGSVVRRVARERPNVPIVTISPYQHTARYLSLVWGVQAFYIPSVNTQVFDDFFVLIKDFIKDEHIAQPGEDVLIITERSFVTGSKSSMLHIVRI